VATTVASTPVKNEPVRPDFICNPAPTPVALRPNSNRPLMLSAKTSITAASPNTKAGDCSWKPQPSWLPPARSTASTPASIQNESSTPRRTPGRGHHLAAVGARLLHEAEDLDPEHGKDARHEVQDQAADEGEEQRSGQADDGGGGSGGKRRVRTPLRVGWRNSVETGSVNWSVALPGLHTS
jgi:hypothetical protein